MKATEPARRLLLLVPALSEAKGWHWQWGQGAHSVRLRLTPIHLGRLPGRGPDAPGCRLNFTQILKDYMVSLKREAATVAITMKSSRTVTCLLASHCMALWPEIQDPPCYL